MNESQPTRKPRRGDELDADLERFDRKGHTLGTSGEYAVRMRGAVPGDRWHVSVKKRRKHTLEAHGLELLEAGEARVEARCQHAEQCGGCSFQACDYDVQVAQKQMIVEEAIAGANWPITPEVDPVLPCPLPWNYRNKMEFTFGARRWIAPEEPQGAESGFALGLHPPGLFSKVINLAECHIVFEGGDRIMTSARDLALEQGLEPWHVFEHTGYLRHLVLRHGVNTNEIMVNLVVSREDPEVFESYAQALIERHPEITTLIETVNSGVASVAYGESERTFYGPGYIEEVLLGTRFRISARSFFQVNTPQAERLFEIVREEAGVNGDEVVYDLYSGAGSIALVLASAVKEVLAFEQVPEAVADAIGNAERNGVGNVRFFEGDVLSELDATLAEGSELPRPDVCIVDPPRAGLHPAVPPKLLALGARRIVYVSCNIHNGAKDMAHLLEGGYRVTRVRPVDLFPHTPHVECVVTMELDPADFA
jgi:23S rRNA (uracil1939-C5)-methyltransferase